jgi:S1-C subfamily serine protease
VLFACALGVSPAGADTGMGACSPEGFSASSEGLPEPVRDAWRATVLIEGNAVVGPPAEDRKLHTNRGAGIVIKVSKNRRTAIVATNSHVVHCREYQCDLRVGFGHPDDSGGQVWSDKVKIVSADLKRDLAFVKVTLPKGASVEAARFATSDCISPDDPDVVAIGWPDLTVRARWGVERPKNHGDHVKRYSEGMFLITLKGYRARPEVDWLLERMRVVFHNADVLPGSSGGPLVNRRGEVLGINTHVVGNTERDAHHRYCARQELHDPGDGCVHLAIASAEVVAAYERAFSSRIILADCVPLTEAGEDRRTASLR